MSDLLEQLTTTPSKCPLLSDPFATPGGVPVLKGQFQLMFKVWNFPISASQRRCASVLLELPKFAAQPGIIVPLLVIAQNAP